MNIEIVCSASIRSRSSSVRPTPRITLSLSERIAPWGSAAISCASSWARAERLPRGTISLTSPMRSASCDVDAPAGDDQLHRLREADDERQAHGHAVAADDVPAPLERAELRVLGDDPDVGQQRGLEAGANAYPFTAAITGLKTSALRA